jgi:3-phenylpropionate/trans-cinnamate dioxygenase ferredoxin reductase component
VPDRRTLVIVAEASRAPGRGDPADEGFDGRIVLVGAETELPDERPPLSKSYLAGETMLAEARASTISRSTTSTASSWSAAAPSPWTVARAVGLADGVRLHDDRLLMATGAVPRRPLIWLGDRRYARFSSRWRSCASVAA